jgi:hypothetical protein
MSVQTKQIGPFTTISYAEFAQPTISDVGGGSTACQLGCLHAGVVQGYNREGQEASDTAGKVAAHITRPACVPGTIGGSTCSCFEEHAIGLVRRLFAMKLGVGQSNSSRGALSWLGW